MRKTVCGLVAWMLLICMVACANVQEPETFGSEGVVESTELTLASQIPTTLTEQTVSPSEPSEIITEPTMTPTAPTEENETIPVTSEPTEPPEPENPVVNILLVGQDRRNQSESGRSDSIILVTFNKSNDTVTLTSFMRDALVQIPGYYADKLNHAYEYGGMSLLEQTLQLNYAVEADGTVLVDFSCFEQVIDTLGGVDITLTAEEANHLNAGNGWSLSAGKQKLNGEQALAYSRIRYIDNDYYRAERQRNVILSLVEQHKNLSVLEIVNLLQQVLPMVSTDMSSEEIMELVLDLVPMLSSCGFDEKQIPAPGTFSSGTIQIREGYKAWFQYDIDFPANRAILQEIFRVE